MLGLAAAERELHAEQRAIRSQVQHEFYDRPCANSLVEREMHNDSAAVQHVYGGVQSSRPREGQIVQAWRPTPWGEWQLGKGIVHRVHNEDQTMTVQFVPDQHRVRLPFVSVKPMFDYTPEYPTVRLTPGERLPTRAEILQREEAANAKRQELGIEPDAPLPGAEGSDLRAGETQQADGSVTLQMDTWGIPAPTLDALRNRSIPPAQVTGEYGRHFYTNLYKNNFYTSHESCWVNASGHVGPELRRESNAGQRVVSHRCVRLDGSEWEQDLHTGSWSPVVIEEAPKEPESFLSEMIWFLG
mmetsp:Transcript_34405/g.79904  ORF Transcript_34405/g.79904 Transcript_34405/m.79904 type:complete len:300 (-) Transcript_34405:94-993(-)